jgi:hypothetical protein
MKYVGWGLALSLVVGLTALAGADEVSDARKEIVDLAREVEGGKDVSAKAAALPKKYDDLETVMTIYKTRARGGLGFGPKAAYGIELKIRDLNKEALSPATLQKESAELLRMAYINLAMAEIVKHYPVKAKNGKGKKDWDQHLEDQKKAAKELIASVKARDPRALKKAADSLDTACVRCHNDFK